MKDKLIKYILIFYRFVLGMEVDIEELKQRDFLSCKGGEAFEN